MTSTIWILGTIDRALKTATEQGLFVQSARLNPLDFKSLADSITKRVASALPVPTSIVLISDEGISVGYTRLECFKLPSGLEFAKQVDELEAAMGVEYKLRKPVTKIERPN